MTRSWRITVTEESQVGEARRCAAELCTRIGADETFCGKISIVATEMARNIVRHGNGGEVLISEIPHPKYSSIDLLALDKGPGMRNIPECMRDGYSTIGTAGMGMGAIQRLSDQFEIHSLAGRGTAIWARLCTLGPPRDSGQFDVGAICLPMRGEIVSGDAWGLIESPGALRVMVADGLGHGVFAEEASREAIAVFRGNPKVSITDTLELTHQALMKTRGAAAAIVELRAASWQLINAGVGNISMRLVAPGKMKNLVSDNGTLGASMRKVQCYTQPWSEETLLVMHSDGLAAQWNLDDYPGLAGRHPSLIAGVLYRDLNRGRDDATVVVARYIPRS